MSKREPPRVNIVHQFHQHADDCETVPYLMLTHADHLTYRVTSRMITLGLIAGTAPASKRSRIFIYRSVGSRQRAERITVVDASVHAVTVVKFVCKIRPTVRPKMQTGQLQIFTHGQARFGGTWYVGLSETKIFHGLYIHFYLSHNMVAQANKNKKQKCDKWERKKIMTVWLYTYKIKFTISTTNT